MACSEAVKGVVVVEVEGVVRAVVRVVAEKVEVNSVALMGVAAMVAELAVAVVATVGHMEAGKLAADAVAVPVVAVAVVATEEQAADAPAREAAAGDPVEAMMEVTTEAITEAATEAAMEATEAATEAATEGSPLPNGWASPSSKTQLRARRASARFGECSCGRRFSYRPREGPRWQLQIPWIFARVRSLYFAPWAPAGRSVSAAQDDEPAAGGRCAELAAHARSVDEPTLP